MQLNLVSKTETLEEHKNDFKKNLQKTNRLTNDQLSSLLIDSLQTIEEQDEEIIQLTGERDAYKQGFEESLEDIKTLNSLLDKYEPRQIDDNMITKINNTMNRSDHYNTSKNQKIEQVRQKTLAIVNKRREISNRLNKNM